MKENSLHFREEQTNTVCGTVDVCMLVTSIHFKYRSFVTIPVLLMALVRYFQKFTGFSEQLNYAVPDRLTGKRNFYCVSF